MVVEGDFDALPVGAVIQDSAGGTQAALEHLAALGHRRIGFVGAEDGWLHGGRRLSGYREFHLRHGLPLVEARIAMEPSMEAGGEAAARRLLALEPRMTALYVSQRKQLPGVLEAARERGLRIPHDLSVVVWGDPESEERPAETTHLSWDRRELGRLALRTLDERALRNTRGKTALLVPAQLVERGSTAPPAP